MSLIQPCQLTVESIDSRALDQLISSAELVVADLSGPKVMQLPNDNFIKLFRRKRFVSSAMFLPYAVRFVNNALQLQRLNIPVLTPVHIQYCPSRKIHIVEYRPLPGELLRDVLAEDHEPNLLEKAACFIAELHDKGVYFRSLHFGNIVVTKDGFGLIDVADMKIYPKPLSQNLRKRNFQHFLRYPEDRAVIEAYGLTEFEKQYHNCANNPAN